jgi:hypothetical protein
MEPHEWPKRMCCFYCWKRRKLRVRAVVRAFAGVDGYGMSGEGWPACEEHKERAISEAMATLGERSIGADWKVKVYAIEVDEHDAPKMHRVLFVARKRAS